MTRLDPKAPSGLSDRAYRMLVNAVSGQAIFLLDTEGRIVSWNPGAERLKGYTAKEAIGRHFSDFYTQEDRQGGLPGIVLDTARRQGRYEGEGWRVRKDGSHFWALAMLEAIRDDGGQLTGFVKVTRDMTERHEAQQALVESERRFRLLVQGVVDYAIFMLDPSGIITNWNTGAARMKGYAVEEIVGQHFSRFYTPEDQADGLPHRALERARSKGSFVAEGWRVRKDGTRFWASVVIDAIHDEDGRLIGFAKITRDMTERYEAQRSLETMREQLIQAQKLEALGQLTGGIAHDFNNILQAIMGGVALATPLAQGNARLATILAEMRNAAARGAALTGQLLAFSRRTPPRLEVIDTALHLRQAVGLFSHALQRDIRIELRLEEDAEEPWPIRSDAAQFELALLNVAVNARDAMPGGGSLSVSARNLVLAGEPEGLHGRFVAITLQDSGEGIPKEVIGRVFEPFFTTKPIGKGTGLGLSHVYGFARQTGGTVTIESEPGQGTEVTFLLPAAAKGELPGQPAAAPPVPAIAEGSGARILVVDDDPVVGRLAAEMLESAGYHATATNGPDAALQRLVDGESYDAVLTDVLMPGTMGGIEFGREVRRRWPELPVLLTTGYTGRPDAERHEFPVLNKPFATSELVRALWELLAAQRRPAAARLGTASRSR
jgi:PAS domain S-box-containing protein